ncbi:MAG TPA: M36 family metallopeptidase [Actinophytocola sp.]|jgi:Zn-dependent metalloprotease|uniref:M36 family metallopeptidase n=1 Tax=Actinophytocola sp. TaxID=1872138 RepID=UPI002F95F7D3
MRLRRLTVAALSVAALVLPLSGASATAAPGTSGLKLVATRDSLLATHYWYAQTYAGHPVLGGYYAKHVDKTSGRVTIDDGRMAVSGLAGTAAPRVATASAKASASNRAKGAAVASEVAVLPGSQAKLVYSVLTRSTAGTSRTLVDATSGAVLKTESLIKRDTGTGTVFSPNPVTTLQDESLTDQDDANAAVPKRAYKHVRLTNLDGSGFLSGAYATIIDPVATQPRSSELEFNYLRANDHFEQVMAYYSVTEAQRYIHRLGFSDVNSEPQDLTTTGFTDDNSFYDPSTDGITFGTGGVDDAEDAEVIWHEYGHAIQDAQVPNFGSTPDAGAIGEGFGDWWALVMSAAVQPDTDVTPLACIMDWDSTSYTDEEPHCLRRTDTDLTYADRIGEVHFDGQIWSRALFDVYNALGRTKAATLVLEAQFSYRPNTKMPAAARVTVDTAKALYGAGAAAKVRAAFEARGIL